MQFYEGITAILAILLAVGLPILTALLISLASIKSKHRERMGLINQGIIPPDTVKQKATPNRFVSLRNGIVLVSLGFGLLLGFVLSDNFAKDESQIFYIMSSSVVFFLGVGYLIYFVLTRKSATLDNERDIAQD